MTIQRVFRSLHLNWSMLGKFITKHFLISIFIQSTNHQYMGRTQSRNNLSNYIITQNSLTKPAERSKINLPASNPFFPKFDGFDIEISAGGASSVRASLHYKGEERSTNLIQLIIHFRSLNPTFQTISSFFQSYGRYILVWFKRNSSPKHNNDLLTVQRRKLNLHKLQTLTK